MASAKAFSLSKDSIDDVARKLGGIYGEVKIAKDPMFAWVLIVNDVTILGEELRRNRLSEGATRAAKVLYRLLEFVGYYLFTHKISGESTFANFVATDVRRHSTPGVGQEGPTRWILAKYPRACSKCGERPCHCLVYPWVFEDRRENPAPYDRFRDKVRETHEGLAGSPTPLLTLLGMLEMFESVYRNAYYTQEPWKVGMHLSEELGEATIELSRLELAWRGMALEFDVQAALPRVFDDAQAKINRELDRLARALEKATGEDATAIVRRQEELSQAFSREKEAYEGGDAWAIFRERVSEKFKEEVADVFSWLSAILVKLDPERRAVADQRSRFVKAKGSVEYLRCPWCGEESCTNECLVTHSVSSEIVEKVTKF